MYLQHAYKGKNDWWRYLVTSVMVIIAYFLTQVPLTIVMFLKASANNDVANIAQYMSPTALGMSQNTYLFMFVAPLIFVFATLVMCMKVLHWHTLQGVFTSFSKFRWRNFFIAAFVWLFMLVVFDVLSYLIQNETFVFHFKAREFFILLIICIIFVPFQSAWEELYFRGNLMQGFGLIFKYRIIPLLITSILFGIVHLSNPEVDKFGTAAAMVQYIGFGIFLGITLLMSGGLEASFGIHIINNFYSLTLVSYAGSVLETPTLISKTNDDIFFQ